MRSLRDILKPYSVEEFLTKNWTNLAVFIPNEGGNKFADLFSWEKLTYLVNFHHFKYPEMRLALDEKVLDESANENPIKHCQEGATLILNGVHKLIPELATFASEIKYDLGCGVQVNAYCSWPHKQGFSSHYDTHEVFILQIDGTKKWYVFPDTFKYPLVEQKSSSLPPPEGEPYLTCTLNKGDVLYIPRGHWHYAIAQNEPSLHLTLGVHCRTGIDFLEWVVSQLRQQEDWRKSLPIGVEKDTAKSLYCLVDKLNKHLAANDIYDEYISYLDSLCQPIARYSLPFQAGFNIFTNGAETKFTNPKFQRVRFSQLSDGSGYKITVAGKEVSLKGIPISVVEKIFTTQTFTGNDVLKWLPDYDWEIDILPLLSRLVVEGIIFVDS
ncbi:cupin domain-containing protein [Iningainema tapete]|uniref:Cupin-like domain-containing protein n=1 Tax=Iningainema tapete BLCC-T55 TaxID=2748662 RepID=A0A8J6XIR7_9CYAN|nr:cupin domain-containing protein [Iningainema tapete]MBD2773532.1 cupin-like domain-containing protein [Iningainema tapete BLCC-T55]